MIKFDLDHIEKRAKEVLREAPELSRLGRPDAREWWCEMLVRCITEVRELRVALAAANKTIRDQDLKLAADAKAIVHLQKELNRGSP